MFYFCSHSILTLEVDTIIIIIIVTVVLQAGIWRTECAHDAMASKCWTGKSLLVKTIACGIGRQNLVDLCTMYTITHEEFQRLAWLEEV